MRASAPRIGRGKIYLVTARVFCGARQCGGRPAAGGADGEDDVLDALIAACAEPCGEGFGGHGAAAAIEQDSHGCDSALLGVETGEERVLGFERLIFERLVPGRLVFGAEQIGRPFKVKKGEGLERILGWKASADVGQSHLHGEEDNAG